MAYDETLAARIHAALASEPVSERKMFGGLTFMLHGNMVCGVMRDEFMARVGSSGYADALAEPHTRPMEFTGRAMTGMVVVDPAGVATDAELAAWVGRCLAHARSLPPKR